MNSVMMMRMGLSISRSSTALAGAKQLAARSGREQLFDVRERLELERVAEWIEEEHRRLLARLAPEADVRLDDEFASRGTEAARQDRPTSRSRQDHAEMPHRNVIAVDQARRVGHLRRRDLVRDDLVAEEIEIDPCVANCGPSAQPRNSP